MTSAPDKPKRWALWIGAVLATNGVVLYVLRDAPPGRILIAAVAASLVLRGVFGMAFQAMNRK